MTHVEQRDSSSLTKTKTLRVASEESEESSRHFEIDENDANQSENDKESSSNNEKAMSFVSNDDSMQEATLTIIENENEENEICSNGDNLIDTPSSSTTSIQSNMDELNTIEDGLSHKEAANATSTNIDSPESLTCSLSSDHQPENKPKEIICEKSNIEKAENTSFKDDQEHDHSEQRKQTEYSIASRNEIDTSIKASSESNSSYTMQPRLKKFLKFYQQSSLSSVNGPPLITQENNLEVEHSTQSLFRKTLNSSTNNNLHAGENDNLAIIACVAAAAAAEVTSSTINGDTDAFLSLSNKRRKSSSFDDLSAPVDTTETSKLKRVCDIDEDNENVNLKSMHSLNKTSGENNVSANTHQQSAYNNHNHHQHHHHKRINSKHLSRYASPSYSSNGKASYMKCIQADVSTSPLMETVLHGERISCFIVGGEKRLCLHDILNTILKDFSVQQINSACQKLQIACLESSQRQLEILKKSQLLPPGAPNCGLLTLTNAERLCAYLMDSSISMPLSKLEQSMSAENGLNHSGGTIKIVHECFGKTYGHIHLDMYTKSDSACVECDTCRKLYTPKNFVCHSHKLESHTRHWGFDSSNWRSYIKLATSSHVTSEKNVLNDLKIANKDNIAANALNSNEKVQSEYEDLEEFKRKFLNQNSHAPLNIQHQNVPNSIITPGSSSLKSLDSTSSSLKRKSICADIELENGLCDNSLKQASIGNNCNKRLNSNGSMSLNEMNNHLLANKLSINSSINLNDVKSDSAQLTIQSGKNNSSSSSCKFNGEHKLLNGLLSKPLQSSNQSGSGELISPCKMLKSSLNGEAHSKQHHDDTICSNNRDQMDKLIKMNSNQKPTQQPNKQFLLDQKFFNINDDFAINGVGSAFNVKKQMLTPSANALIDSVILKDGGSATNYGLNNSPLSGNKLNTKSLSNLSSVGLSQSSSSINIELSMLEMILNEIDTLVENKESSQRLRQLIVHMHVYFNEKINDQQAAKNKLISEFDEFKSNLQAENEQLRCQLKLLQIQNEYNNNKEFVKKTQSSPINLNNNTNNSINSYLSNSSKLLTHSSPPNKTLLSTQNIQFLLNQQHQSNGKNSHAHSALLHHQDLNGSSLAAQSTFPQYFLSQYNLNRLHQSIDINEPGSVSTSTPKSIIDSQFNMIYDTKSSSSTPHVSVSMNKCEQTSTGTVA